MSYRPVTGRKKKMVRLKLGKSYIYISRQAAGLVILITFIGFLALAGFLYWLWYIRLPELTGP